MVNRVLTPSGVSDNRTAGRPRRLHRFECMIAASAQSTVPAKPEGRSPFVRLAELLADIKPGKPPINLSVGVPRRGDPACGGPILSSHSALCGRSPANKGTDAIRAEEAA